MILSVLDVLSVMLSVLDMLIVIIVFDMLIDIVSVGGEVEVNLGAIIDTIRMISLINSTICIIDSIICIIWSIVWIIWSITHIVVCIIDRCIDTFHIHIFVDNTIYIDTVHIIVCTWHYKVSKRCGV